MFECPCCDCEIDEEDLEFECPFCGETDVGDGFCRCENCGALFDDYGDMWTCPYCDNEGITETEERREVVFFDVFDDDDCDELIPDVNQGWVGEHYGK